MSQPRAKLWGYPSVLALCVCLLYHFGGCNIVSNNISIHFTVKVCDVNDKAAAPINRVDTRRIDCVTAHTFLSRIKLSCITLLYVKQYTEGTRAQQRYFFIYL